MLPLARFKYWDATSQSFQLEAGACTIQVGPSAADLPLTTTIELG
jgi:hypothetical protein